MAMIRPFLEAKSINMEGKKILISIGREFGAGGKLIADEIGKRLGIDVYDNELISKAAETSGFSKELFSRSDEKRSIFSMSSFFAPTRFAPSDNYISDNELFKMQSAVIKDIAEKGSAIFIGRCSDYILRDMDCLDIFITAPENVRVARVAEREGISEEEAKSITAKKNRTRQTYYNYFTYGEWGNASNYDLCIDSSILGIEGTADMIIEFAKKKGMI